ncbi:MAG: hypothetical protein M3256_05495 [Actinomycetota bacterium]|nr:hypothetical protein [Actinomycetota bacterium]
MAALGLLVLGAIIGFIINETLSRSLGFADRRRARRNPLVVHVETDPAVIWAGMPPWIGARFLMPLDADISSPPASCPHWRSWAHALGGVDSHLTQVRITLTAKQALLVVVDGLRVNVHSRKSVPPWRSVICAVGGASISPRRAEIRLSQADPPTVEWAAGDGDVVGVPSFSVSTSEVEMLHVWAYVEDEWVEWTAELLVLVDGHRQVINISNNGKRFVTSGAAGAASEHMWVSGSDHWVPPLAG